MEYKVLMVKSDSADHLATLENMLNDGWEVQRADSGHVSTGSILVKYGYIISQFKYSKIRKKRVPPPNCLSSNYYPSFGVCKKDNLCEKIKNPVSYSVRKVRYIKKK